MAGPYYVFFALLAVANAQQVVNGKIKITTVTTAGCGDTMNFISRQLAPVYNEFERFLELEFVPWGRTVRNADGSLTCQFGTRDCWANRVHRCVLDRLRGDPVLQMYYMNCEFTSPYPAFLQGTYFCAPAVGVSLADLDVCVSTSAGDFLDSEAEVLATEPMQIINFVPAIVFNDQIDWTLHSQAWTNLRNTICSALARDPSTGVTNCA